LNSCDERMKEDEGNVSDGEPQSKDIVVLDGVVPIFHKLLNTNFSQWQNDTCTNPNMFLIKLTEKTKSSNGEKFKGPK